MRGLLLAGGSGTRLYPTSRSVNKHLLPVFDKPLIYYPISTLIMAGIREILVITNATDLLAFHKLLGDGSQWGIRIQFAVQPEPRGLADAFIIGRSFIRGEPTCLILGDNILYAEGLISTLERCASLSRGAKIFAYRVRDPRPYGVVTFSPDRRVTDIVEKPEHPPSNFAIPGIYFCDGDAADLARDLSPSSRGELEITDLLRRYLDQGKLAVEVLGRGTAWLDAGTPEGLVQAINFIHALETRQDLRIGCPEEVAFRKGFIDARKVAELASHCPNSGYGDYLARLSEECGS